MDQNKLVYIVVDRVGAPYQVLLYQPSIRFSLLTNSKVLSLQQLLLKARTMLNRNILT